MVFTYGINEFFAAVAAGMLHDEHNVGFWGSNVAENIVKEIFTHGGDVVSIYYFGSPEERRAREESEFPRSVGGSVGGD